MKNTEDRATEALQSLCVSRPGQPPIYDPQAVHELLKELNKHAESSGVMIEYQPQIYNNGRWVNYGEGAMESYEEAEKKAEHGGNYAFYHRTDNRVASRYVTHYEPAVPNRSW